MLLFHFTELTTPGRSWDCYCHFTDMQTEAKKGQITCPRCWNVVVQPGIPGQDSGIWGLFSWLLLHVWQLDSNACLDSPSSAEAAKAISSSSWIISLNTTKKVEKVVASGNCMFLNANWLTFYKVLLWHLMFWNWATCKCDPRAKGHRVKICSWAAGGVVHKITVTWEGGCEVRTVSEEAKVEDFWFSGNHKKYPHRTHFTDEEKNKHISKALELLGSLAVCPVFLSRIGLEETPHIYTGEASVPSQWPGVWTCRWEVTTFCLSESRKSCLDPYHLPGGQRHKLAECFKSSLQGLL